MNLCVMTSKATEDPDAFEAWLAEHHPGYKLIIYEDIFKTLGNMDETILESMQEAGWVLRVCYTGPGIHMGNAHYAGIRNPEKVMACMRRGV